MVAMCVGHEELAHVGERPAEIGQRRLEQSAGPPQRLTRVDQGQPGGVLDCIDVDRSQLVGKRKRYPVHSRSDQYRTRLRPGVA